MLKEITYLLQWNDNTMGCNGFTVGRIATTLHNALEISEKFMDVYDGNGVIMIQVLDMVEVDTINDLSEESKSKGILA